MWVVVQRDGAGNATKKSLILFRLCGCDSCEETRTVEPSLTPIRVIFWVNCGAIEKRFSLKCNLNDALTHMHAQLTPNSATQVYTNQNIIYHYLQMIFVAPTNTKLGGIC